MKAKLLRDSQGNIVVQMQGDFDFATSAPLRKKLEDIIETHPKTKLQLDLSGMSFVGSSGISHFVETLKILANKKSEKIKLSNVSDDFSKVFKIYGLEAGVVDIGLDDNSTYDLNMKFGSRKRTFEN
jgi:anti-sigma B factor antagonist